MGEIRDVRASPTVRYPIRISLLGEDQETALSEFGRSGAAFAAAHLSALPRATDGCTLTTRRKGRRGAASHVPLPFEVINAASVEAAAVQRTA